MVSAIYTSLGSNENQPERPLVIGKPNPFSWELIKIEHQLTGCRAIMIGDRMDTDIKFGYNAQIDTCLVLSGCTETLEQVH